MTAFVTMAGCSSSVPEKPSEEFFDPVRVTNVTRSQEGETLPELSGTPGAAEPMIRQMMREQQQRMSALERRLSAMETQQEVAKVETERRRDLTAAEETLLAMIREQNLRLDEIIEQVRLMAERPAASATRPRVQRPATTFTDEAARRVYASAVAAYQRRDYRQAETHFEEALARSIRLSLADNCRFWIGVSRFQRRDLSGALASFAAVTKEPGSDKRSSALLMIGQVYEGMGRVDLARSSYRRIVAEHPRSSLRSVAERKLAVASPGARR